MSETENSTGEVCPRCSGELSENEQELTECEDCGVNQGQNCSPKVWTDLLMAVGR